MNDEYLWDRSGKPDEEIVRLETLLAPLRHREAQPVRRRPRAVWWLAAAAALIATVVSVPRLTQGPVTDWRLASGSRIRAGQWIEGGKIESNRTGELRVDTGSRLRLLGTDSFRLERGTIHAFIWAPPGRFVVDTPSSKAVDLGCRYTLHVAGNGEALVTVEFGWVAFESHGIESFVPEGAACVTRPDRGAGTPYFTDASAAFQAALENFDKTADPAALQSILNGARPRDALTLWHLLSPTHGQQRGEVFDRFAALVALPPDVSRDAILRGDPAAFDAAWAALKLGDTKWWRKWKSPALSAP